MLSPMTSTRELGGRLALVAMAVLLSLVIAELGCRLWRGTWFLSNWPNLIVLEARTKDADACGFRHDAALGFAPVPNCSSSAHSHDARGFRAMPGVASSEQAILAVGDSYTYGDDVADGETWPVFLQKEVGRRTINAGVPGYGLDQTVLRAEQIATAERPALILVGFIADDLRRAEMSRLWGMEKPYFEPVGDALVLRQVPVPPFVTVKGVLSFWRRALGWSVLVDEIVRGQDWYPQWYWNDTRATPSGTGERMACPLMQRLARLDVPTLVVAQYFRGSLGGSAKTVAEDRRQSLAVLRCAEQAGLGTVDTYRAIRDGVTARGIDAFYGPWHHNTEGNRLVAAEIAAEMKRRGMAAR